MTLGGMWAKKLWVDKDDIVRVIGTFNKTNKFQLLLDDNIHGQETPSRARMIIVDPHTLITTT